MDITINNSTGMVMYLTTGEILNNGFRLVFSYS
jgi:hypothetical protein